MFLQAASRSNDVVQLAMAYEVDEGNKDADDDLDNVYIPWYGMPVNGLTLTNPRYRIGKLRGYTWYTILSRKVSFRFDAMVNQGFPFSQIFLGES